MTTRFGVCKSPFGFLHKPSSVEEGMVSKASLKSSWLTSGTCGCMNKSCYIINLICDNSYQVLYLQEVRGCCWNQQCFAFLLPWLLWHCKISVRFIRETSDESTISTYDSLSQALIPDHASSVSLRCCRLLWRQKGPLLMTSHCTSVVAFRSVPSSQNNQANWCSRENLEASVWKTKSTISLFSAKWGPSNIIG